MHEGAECKSMHGPLQVVVLPLLQLLSLLQNVTTPAFACMCRLCLSRCASWQQQKPAAQQQQQQTGTGPLVKSESMMLGVLLLAVAGLALLRCWLLLLAAAWCWGREGCGQTMHMTGLQQQVRPLKGRQQQQHHA
jgi:hypothetical protein